MNRRALLPPGTFAPAQPAAVPVARPRRTRGTNTHQPQAPAAAGHRAPAVCPPTGLTESLSSWDRRPEEKRTNPGNYMHVSSLVRATCPRQAVLEVQSTGARGQRGSYAVERIVWALGRAAEKHVRNGLEAANPGLLFGGWRCPCGALHVTMTHAPLAPCGVCGKAAEYEEPELISDDALLLGHTDALFATAPGKLGVMECKSICKADFEALEAPQADHALQAALYRRMAAEMLGEDRVSETITIFYVCKAALRASPYKVFPLEPARSRQQTVDMLWQFAQERKRHVQAGTLPPRVSACTSMLAKRAKGCSECAACFR